MDDPFKRTSLGAAVFYKDPMAALDWLERTFGFRRAMVITDKDGNLAHVEMRFRDGYLIGMRVKPRPSGRGRIARTP
jgi:uncharacterized glyoxalase superfamily protein PhnB